MVSATPRRPSPLATGAPGGRLSTHAYILTHPGASPLLDACRLSPVLLVAKGWYASGLTCGQRTIATLYVMPVIGDAVQFIIIDQIQKFKEAPSPLLPAGTADSGSEDAGLV